MTDVSGSPVPDEVDPLVAELVMAIRDRFGVHGLRSAASMIEDEIAIAEKALEGLPTD
jgi:hypothetical protein